MTKRPKAALEAFYHAVINDDASDLYDRAPCGFLSTMPDGSITKVNETFLTWTGYSLGDLLGRRFNELLSVGGQIFYETHFAPIMQMHGQVREVAFDVVRPDGTTLPTLVTSVTDELPNGQSVIRTVVFDATERRRYEHELLLAKERAEASEAANRALATTLQETLIPPTVPTVDGLDIAAVYRPAGAGDEVGGDFYDLFQAGGESWILVVGDVCGKGSEAAVVTSAARFTVRAAAMDHSDLGEVLQVVNAVLLAHESNRFCTIGMIKLECHEGRWYAAVATAGHPPAVYTPDGGQPAEVASSGTVAGIIEKVTFRQTRIALSPGDSLVLYTDGVTEARSGADFYGERRLLSTVARHNSSADSLATGLLDDVLAFQGGWPRDDIVIAAIRIPD